MASNTRTRASDADRDRTVAALREHLAAGLLTLEEFDERMDKAYAAKTLGELDNLMADLPETDPGQLPSAPVDRSAAGPPLTRRRPPGSIEAGRGGFSPAWRSVWGSWGLAISLFLFVIWLASGALRRPVVLVGGAGAGCRPAGAPDHGRACAQGTKLARPRRNHRHSDDQARP